MMHLLPFEKVQSLQFLPFRMPPLQGDGMPPYLLGKHRSPLLHFEIGHSYTFGGLIEASSAVRLTYRTLSKLGDYGRARK